MQHTALMAASPRRMPSAMLLSTIVLTVTVMARARATSHR